MLETTSGARPPINHTDTNLFLILVPTVVMIILGLLTVLMIIAACIWRTSLCKKKERGLPSSGRDNQEYDDIVIGPVYETIQPAGDLVDDTQVIMTNNEAYKTIAIPVKRTNITSLDVDVVNTKAHDTSGTGLILMEKNTSYQITVPKRSPITTSSEILPTSQY